MMTQSTIYILAGLLLLVTTVLLLRRPRTRLGTPPSQTHTAAEFFPVNARYFPQVRHAFSAEDAQYLAGRSSRGVTGRWKKSLRRAGRLYLEGLREDFARLDRLARQISLFSPQIRLQQEAELFSLNLRFQLLYGYVWLRFFFGRPAATSLERMASLVGNLGSRLEGAALAPDVSSGAVTP